MDTPTHDEIALAAYALWERKGGGMTVEDEAVKNWLEAEEFLIEDSE